MKSIRIFLLVGILLACVSTVRADEVNEEFGKLYRSLGLASYVVKAGDFASTEYGFANYPGVRELHPMFQSRDARIVGTIALPIFFNWATNKVYRSGHERIALWMRIAYVAFNSVVIVSNLSGGF